MKKPFNKNIIIVVALAVLVIVGVGIDQVLILNKAHSTFDNYYAFRGCVQLIERNATDATCVTDSGAIIKIVEINNKWYLDGDGPGVW